MLEVVTLVTKKIKFKAKMKKNSNKQKKITKEIELLLEENRVLKNQIKCFREEQLKSISGKFLK